jgi:hypothetical protein
VHTFAAEANVLQGGLASQVGSEPVCGLPVASLGESTVCERSVLVCRVKAAVERRAVITMGLTIARRVD